MVSTLSIALLISAGLAQQQAPPAMDAAAALRASFDGVKSLVTGEATKMPDSDYGSKPSSMPEVRTFGQVVAHIAEAQFDTCARVEGVANPNGSRRLEQELKTKAQFEKALADSFAFCADALSGTTDANVLQPIHTQFGPRSIDMPRISVLYGLIAHTSEMYGIGTVYLRAKGLVPPASEPSGRGR